MGVDYVIATDNRSVDGTTELLRDYERRGVLRYLFEGDDDYSQHRWVTRMARMAHAEFGADWVINNDADEFWWPARGDLKETLGAVPPECAAVKAERLNFVPRTFGSERFFADEMTVKERRSFNALGNPLPGKVCHRGFADIDVLQGNHLAARAGVNLPTEPAGIEILHFPMRSYEQFQRKIVHGGSALARNTYLPKATNDNWRHLYELWLAGGLEAYYRTLIPDDHTIEAKLRVGELLVDERLKLFLAGVGA
jgi:hypothetical protein